jgi:SNF2 family DNA or RNA helicase
MAVRLQSWDVTDTSIEPGDRFEVVLADPLTSQPALCLPPLLAVGESIDSIEDQHGQPLRHRRDAADPSRIVLRELKSLLPEHCEAIWLECVAPGQWRLVVEAAPCDALSEPLPETTEQGVPIRLDAEDWQLVCGGMRPRATPAEFELALRAARLATHTGFDRLICLPMVREMELLEHQIRTAKTVLRRFRGRALLCDEVGLGKTIEAGLVLSELLMRGLARSVLVLVPPSLIEQWQGELRRKFAIELTSHDDPAFRQRGAAAWNEFDRVIVSLHTAKRDPHRSAIAARKWDIVIIDEAHHLRNRNTQLWRMAGELQKQFILLLTATPVQNHLEELFNLVTLLEPGLLRTAKQFARQFVDRRDKLTPRNVDELHRLLGEVMVRNRRSTVGLQFTRRWARTEAVTPSPAERELYEAVTQLVREQLRGTREPTANRSPLSRMALMTLQMALGSSSQAAAHTLESLAAHAEPGTATAHRLNSLADSARQQTESAKADRLLQLLGEFPDKMVIFTQFRATQEMLAARLRGAGHALALFHGGLSRLDKEAAVAAFRGPDRLLLCTESGSEGRNLQFAHALCNFDLPWNPMKIEQRIGRLSRIGQTHDVHVFNLVAAGTLEAAVLHLLAAKLCMFELVIGEIDMILGNLDEPREFHDLVADLWADSCNTDDFSRRMNELGDHLLQAKAAYLEQRAHEDRLFGDRFTPEG